MENSPTSKQTPTFTTPMMQQYQEIKKQHQDCLLFFRLGDFYELFHDDALVGSQTLNITLTKRPRGKDGDIPMAGVPFHAADAYIAKLLQAGHKVAICEQVSEPNNKGIVQRQVIRIITPGTILDEKILSSKEHNHVMAVAFRPPLLGLAVADVSTGDFQASELEIADDLPVIFGNELARFSPSECLVSPAIETGNQLLHLLSLQKGVNLTRFPGWEKYASDATKKILSHFKITTLQSFGLEKKPLAAEAAAALLGYLQHTQQGQVEHIQAIRYYHPDQYLLLDRSTIANLELFSTIREHDHIGSFIQVIDRTATAMGGRMLREWVRKPLTDKKSITKRLNAVEKLLNSREKRQRMRDILSRMADLPRLLARLSIGIGNAYDLVNIKNTLRQARKIKKIMVSFADPLLDQVNQALPDALEDIIALIETTIIDNPPIDTKNGGLIRAGLHPQLDELRSIIHGGKDWIARLEAQEKNRTQINSLKIKYNKIFGYYIEISKANLHLVPTDYLRKQTMVNAERFITAELKSYEEKILTAQDTVGKLEYQLFLETVHQVLSYTPTLQKASRRLGMLDCLISLSDVAEKNHYVKPKITSERRINIQDGRHPVVEQLTKEPFVPNDAQLNSDGDQLWIITGPNMAGKSVFMRQVALIALMAHLGSFVPAQSAEIGLLDRIFVRSGASDFITSGLSTFMVEMVETAHILGHATNRSLVVMDEIGRGTSTYDGISIAWAVAEYLVKNPASQALTLFATHYHELQLLEDQFPDKIKNYQVAVSQKNDGDPIFLHKVMPGRSSHSYAIAVAKLAGVPKSVTDQATRLLKNLEKKNFDSSHHQPDEKISPKKSSDEKFQSIAKNLLAIDTQNLTPIEALNQIALWQKELKKIS